VTPNGAAIRTIRQLRGFGLRQLAEVIGISPTYLSRIERDQRGASDSLRQDIADALGAPVEAITREKQ
jgi:transcriptional regulator with XRE-family HTH domain